MAADDTGSKLDAARSAARACRRCPLWEHATRTVFGDGPAPAALVMVGEQPGDQEDRQGRPFVGPAGRVLAEALRRAGVERDSVYVTNAVKHFKWKPRGKRRIHETPNRTEVAACSPWLTAELDLVRPRVVVALGATAGRALLGGGFRLADARGEARSVEGRPHQVVATVHPSYVVRLPGSRARDVEMEAMAADLRLAARLALPARQPDPVRSAEGA